MEWHEKALPAAGWDSCAQNLEKNKESGPARFPADRRDRLALLATAAVCVLAADSFWSLPAGAGLTALIWGWYALALTYLGRKCLRRGECRTLLAANLALALTFSLTSDWYFRLWNFLALAALVPIHAMALSGAARMPWWRCAMLWERLTMTLRGVFGGLGALPTALAGQGKNRRGLWTAALGTVLAAALVLLLLPVLGSADALFASVTASFRAFVRRHLTECAGKLLVGLVLTPFAFSLLYTLRRPLERRERGPVRQPAAEPLIFLIVLSALCGLYALFLAVQFRGLAGGAAYLESRGISYSEWARSGFFQMAGVTAVNLTVLLCALQWSRRVQSLRFPAAVLVAESLALLASAAIRMTLYVEVYGLSFRRMMTYWGMGMMAVFLLTGLVAALRPGFSFCRVAFAAALIGWLAVNCVPIDALVARDGVSR